MKFRIAKAVTVSLLFSLFCFGLSYASINTTNGDRPVILKPNQDIAGHSKPKTPPLIQLSATIDRDRVTITSSENVIARVTITDFADEECYFDNVVSISPAYTCILPDITGELTLHIIIDDIEYIGYLDLD